MSDHDPIDEAYARAEALQSDATARAARRARVLAAVDAASDQPATVARKVPRYAPWLAAASVAAVSTLFAVQVFESPTFDAPPPPAANPPTAPVPPPVIAAPAETVAPPVRTEPSPRPRTPARAPAPLIVIEDPPPTIERRVEEAPPIPPMATTTPRPEEPGLEEVVVSGSRIAPAPTRDIAARQVGLSPIVRRLHAAASAGDLAELSAQLRRGASVDAADRDGETALMKSVQAGHAPAAALLRSHGASLDRANKAGLTARDMAARLDDPEMDRALGLDR